MFDTDKCLIGVVCDLKTGFDELNVPSHSIYLDGLQVSGWLKHIRAILEAAAFIAEVSFF